VSGDIGLSSNMGKFRETIEFKVMKKAICITILCSFFFVLIGQVNGQTLSNSQIIEIENLISSIFDQQLVLAEKLNYDELCEGVDSRHRAGFITNGNYYSDYYDLIKVVKSSSEGVYNQHIVINDKKNRTF
jgi:hypothetical protein